MTTMFLGTLSPNITTSSLTATSVTVSWSQRPFSFTPVGYEVVLSRVTGFGQVLCFGVPDYRDSIGTSRTSQDFNNLEEFSTYRVIVTATFNVYDAPSRLSAGVDFNTSSVGIIIIQQ